LSSILPFIFVLGVLVFVHELGHFLLARWHGVRVLVFSLGFGPKLLKTTRGDTEYCVSIIPLGGYVKMAGETPEDDAPPKPDEFFAKSKWQRFQIYLAGPVMNVVAAIVIMAGVFMTGASEPAYKHNPPEVGVVEKGSPADLAGITVGDRITRLAGYDTPDWNELQKAMLPAAGREIEVVFQRGGETHTVRLTPATRTKYHVGDIGVVPMRRLRVGGITGEPAASAGIRSGDVLLAIDGTSVDIETAILTIQQSVGKTLTLRMRRGNGTVDIPIVPAQIDGVGRISIVPREEEVTVRAASLPEAVRLSVENNLESAGLVFRTLRGLIVGEASPKQLTGFIGIAQASGTMARVGASALFTFMAMLSINLAILNLLPIPMLDGGHIFIMLLEGVARRDFSLRVKERLLMAGFVLVMTLMVTVIYNDLMRIEWIEKLVPWR
jgi:regulator of sigma E protease